MEKMIRSVVGKVMWVGRATVFLVGLAVILALVFGVVSKAGAHSGSAGLFHLNHNNTVTSALTKLTGNLTGAVLKLDNNGSGSALSLEAGTNIPPMVVNAAAGTATGLSADELDGKNSSEFATQAGLDSEANARASADTTLSNQLSSHNHDAAYVNETDYEDSDVLAKVKNVDGLSSGLDADTLDGKNSTDFQSYKRTVVVSPVPNDAVASGTALKNALNGITTASQTNPYLLKIEPGVYELGSLQFSRLDMQSFVDVEGSGEGVTTITSSNSSGGTVRGAANSELRSLTVKHTGGPNGAIAILNFANNFRVTHVTAAASGEGPVNEGLNNFGTAILSHVTATASGASARNTGVNINGTTTLDQVTATGTGGSVDGSRGVEISAVDATAVLSQVTATASGGPFSYGVLNVGDTEIHDSRIAGGTATLGNNAGTMRVGASQLTGPPPTKSSGTTLTCAGVYDENYTFSTGPDCP